LAPYRRYTASGDAERDIAPLEAKIAAKSELYGKTIISGFTGGEEDIAPPASADFVLTFRNILNWLRAGTADAAFRSFFEARRNFGR
jgi:predicted methyltransferase